MTRGEYNRKRRVAATERAVQVARDRHVRLEAKRIAQLEVKLIAAYISEIEAFLTEAAS